METKVLKASSLEILSQLINKEKDSGWVLLSSVNSNNGWHEVLVGSRVSARETIYDMYNYLMKRVETDAK